MVPTVVVSSLTWFTVDVPQASEAVGGVNTGVPLHAIVASAPGEPITGAVVSRTVTVLLFCALVLPHASTACQVTRSEERRVGQECGLVSLSCTTVAPPHASLAVGAVKLGVAGHSMVASAAGLANTSAVVSRTVTVLLFCALVFPHASTACQVTVSE